MGALRSAAARNDPEMDIERKLNHDPELFPWRKSAAKWSVR